ncbi:MAG: histidine kinase dimerization/phospho-acceptor domain-containing protein, partial [Eubacteriales bacterium]|nr:histidine kinase dimerization/phospho-acceptor domain-containing protein [Eubacteriales bacterium]
MFRKIYRSMNIMSFVTLAMTTILIISACYATFNKRLEVEVMAEGQLLKRIIDMSGNAYIDEIRPVVEGKRVTIISPDGKALYDSREVASNGVNYLKRPEIKDAFADGEGSYTLNNSAFYYALRLDNGCVLRVANEKHNIATIFADIIIPIIFTVLLIYVLCIFFSKHITSSILRPINNIDLNTDDYSGVYDELVPIFKRLSGQNREIQHQVEKVKREELKLETVSDNMNEGLIVTDKNHRIILANNSLSQIFDMAKEKMQGMNIDDVLCDDSFKSDFLRVYDGEQLHKHLMIKDKTFQVFLNPVFENGIVKGAIVLMFDISEEMKVIGIRREFSANVSHELKTPLTTILGYSQIINNDIAKPEDVKKFTGKIEKEATRLITLINDIIKLSRLDEEEHSGEKTTLSLKHIVLDVIDALSERAEGRGVTFIYNGDDTDVYANYNQITELVYNLCDNAVKY